MLQGIQLSTQSDTTTILDKGITLRHSVPPNPWQNSRINTDHLCSIQKLMGNIGFSCDCVFEEPVAGTHRMNEGTSQLLTITEQQFDG
jgi:hypothetical protein